MMMFATVTVFLCIINFKPQGFEAHVQSWHQVATGLAAENRREAGTPIDFLQ